MVVLGTGRAITAQAMISNVVEPEYRGSFMSFNSSMQQLGSAIASFTAGFIVIKDHAGRILRYEWVGYLSIFVLLLALLLARYLFAPMDKKILPISVSDTQGTEDLPARSMVNSEIQN